MSPVFKPESVRSHALPLAARPALGALLIASAFAASAQQWTAGEAEWNTRMCASCHASNLFTLAVMQSSYANNTSALARLNFAISSNSIPMGAFRPGGATPLSDPQKDALSYFISNFRAEPNLQPLSPTTLQANQETTVRLFNNGKRALQIASNGGIVMTGANANQFNVRGINNTCFGLVVQPASSCDVAIRYQPTGVASSAHSATLQITHNGEPQGVSVVVFSGSAGPSPTPAPSPSPTPAPSSGGGGGSLAPGWLALLLPVALGLRRPLRPGRRAYD